MISFDAPAYLRQLKALLPPGKAFNLESDGEVSKTLAAYAEELARIDARGVQLIEESDPRTADETIEQWEEMLSLPDEQVLTIPATLPERQVAVTQKYTNRGGQNAEFFVRLAAACGYQLVDVDLATPVPSIDEVSGDGLLADGTYYYRVSAISPYGESVASVEVPATVSFGGVGAVRLIWGFVDGATAYRVYARTHAAETLIAVVSGGEDQYVDDGSISPSAVAPVAGPNPLAYKGIELFAGAGLFREGDRADERCFDEVYAYAMRLNLQDAASPPALSHTDLERVIRHATHTHIQVIFVYH